MGHTEFGGGEVVGNLFDGRDGPVPAVQNVQSVISAMTMLCFAFLKKHIV